MLVYDQMALNLDPSKFRATVRLTGTVGLKKEKENANVALPRINVVKIKKTLPLLPDSKNAVVSLFFCNFFPAPLGRQNDRRFHLQKYRGKGKRQKNLALNSLALTSFQQQTTNKPTTQLHNCTYQ